MSIWILIIAQWLLVVIGIVAAELALHRRLSG